MRSIAGTQDTFSNHFLGNGLQVVRLTDCGKEIDKAIGKVDSVIDQFGCLVIPWENVMVIVPSLAETQETEDCGVGGTD